MSQVKPYILKLKPACKDYIWGGRRLIDEYNIECDMERLSEAWVFSAHKDGNSTVLNGQLAGKTLLEAIGEMDGEPMGENSKKFEYFPVLIKLIDAKRDLSIQVHPDDAYAAKHEGGYGKTEVWYVVDCEEGAGIYFGFKEEITKEEMRRSIEENTITDALMRVDAKKGDCFFIPSGTVHAIGAGMLIAEIQQNSNSTYRVYDYGRLGADGKPRELHIEKAIDVSKTVPAQAVLHSDPDVIADCEYFKAVKKALDGSDVLTSSSDSFTALLAVAGCGTITCANEGFDFKAGDCFFIPAGYPDCVLSGDAELISVTV